MKKIVVAFIVCVASVSHAFADESEMYARMGRATWSSFECSVLAEKIGNSAEQRRLFAYGLQQGRIFIEAVRAGKVKKEHLHNSVPIGLLWRMEGPSADFILGRTFESAIENALKEVSATGDHLNSDSEQKSIASSKFSHDNCSLIGGA